MKIYVSSTLVDLKDYRQAVISAIRRLEGYECISMEDYGAEDQLPVDKCLTDVASSDIYVGIFAWRYGYIPENFKHSITELEYRKAVEMKIPTLIFLLDEDVDWRPKYVDHGEDYNRIISFREECKRLKLVDFFQNPSDLTSKAVTSIIRASKSRLPTVVVATKGPRVSIAHLPMTGAAQFGRDREIKQLEDAWQNQKINLVSVIAWGGAGKSSLINTWLAKMAKDGYRNAVAVYGWSFYDAEIKNNEASADVFIASALTWFGDPDPSIGSSWEKGLRLADLVRSHRTLLILDGLESVQYHVGKVLGKEEGRLRDQSLQALLLELSGQNPGLCLVSSRLSLTDLKSFIGNTVEEIHLNHLDGTAGAELLSSLGVRGTKEELIQATQEFGGHALSLTLLGSYLVDACDGDIARRAEIGSHEEDSARRVMEVYEEWLGDGSELCLLRLLGIFNRPAPGGAINAIHVAPVITNLTDHLPYFDSQEWRRAVSRLRKLKLVADRNPDRPDLLDTHALVRQHFSQQLQEQFITVWKEANRRLFEYYKDVPQMELPDTLDDMTHLFHAVAHGCQAGLYREAWSEVYWPRIRRNEDGYSVLELGAYGADTAAASNFFRVCWNQPVDELDDLDRAHLLTEVAFNLRGMGRLEDAVIPLRIGLDMHTSRKEWNAAGNAAGNLSELLVTLGELKQATVEAKLSVEYAKNAGDQFLLVTNMSTLADTLFHLGNFTEAEHLFRDADLIYKKSNPGAHHLHALLIYHFCDLLLDNGNFDEVIQRAKLSIQIEKRPHRIGLAHLAMGRAIMYQSIALRSEDFSQAITHMNFAIHHLREAKHQELLVRGLLGHAELHRRCSEFEKARAKLGEAAAIASRGQMRVLTADACLESVYLHIACNQSEEARQELINSSKRIEAMNYRRLFSKLKSLRESLFQ